MLEKSDLKEIKKIVTDVVETRVAKSEAYLEDRIEYAVMQSEHRLEKKIEDTVNEAKDELREELGNKIESEVDSLADMNRDFMAKVDNHEVRIKKLEVKAVK